MTTVRRAVASLLLLIAAACTSQSAEPAVRDWRASVPGDWLVAIEVQSVAQLEERLPKLLEPWGRNSPPLKALLANVLPGVALADRPWSAVLVEDANGQPTPLLFVPTDDFEGLCDALDADLAEDLAIVSIGGFDLALQEFGGWARIGLLDHEVDMATVGSPPTASEGNVRLCVSPRGWRAAAKHLKALRRGQIAAGQGRIGPWKWPLGVIAALDRLAPYGPFAQRLADYGCPTTIGLGFDEATESLQASISLPVPALLPPVGSVPPSLPASEPIVWTVSPGPLPPIAIDLFLAWTRCRPEEIEASEYPEAEWQAFAKAERELLQGYQSASYVLELPNPTQPVSANKVVAFKWSAGTTRLGELLLAAGDEWNKLLLAADTRSPTPVEIVPLKETAGWEITVDLFKQAGLESTPEIEALFDRFYGHGGKAVTQLIPSRDQEWRIVMHPSFNKLTAAELTLETTPTTLMLGECYVHRLFDWKQQVDDIGKQNDLGRRVRLPMAEAPPVRFRLIGGEATHAEAVLPLATYEEAVKYWRSKTRPTTRGE